MHPKSDFQLRQAAHFPSKNSINKPAMNQRRLLIAAVFHFKHPVEKRSKKHHKLTKYAVSFSCQSKQGSRYNFKEFQGVSSIELFLEISVTSAAAFEAPLSPFANVVTLNSHFRRVNAIAMTHHLVKKIEIWKPVFDRFYSGFSSRTSALF